MTLQIGDELANRLSKAHEEQITTYLKAINFLLKSHATDFNLAKVKSEISALLKHSIET